MSDLTTRAARVHLPAALAAAVLGAVSLGLAKEAAAQAAWPNRPVKIVIGVAAGSSGDTVARILAPHLQELWKQPVIVENRPGAGGVIGTEFVINSSDGHTLLFGTHSSILPKYTTKSVRYDPLTDLVPIYRFNTYELILATNPETAAKARTLADLVALSKSTDKGIFFAGLGPGSVFNVFTGTVNQTMGMRYTAVNFNGVGPMNIAVMRNDAQLLLNAPGSLKPLIDAGSIVPLAALSTERYKSLPNVPTIGEATGHKGMVPQSWAGFFAPKGTPAAVVEQIARDFQTLANNAALRNEVESKVSCRVHTASSPAAFARDIQEDVTAFLAMFKATNFQPE